MSVSEIVNISIMNKGTSMTFFQKISHRCMTKPFLLYEKLSKPSAKIPFYPLESRRFEDK